MRTYRHESFIRRDFGFYDSGVIPVIGQTVFTVYEFLRRHVWRSLETGNPIARRMFQRNKLATIVTQQFIADNLDFARRQTITEYIRLMKTLRWVVVHPPTKEHPNAIYELGERYKDSQGGWGEVFYADAWMMSLWDRLQQEAQRRFGEDAHPLKMSPEDRRQIVKQYVADTSDDLDADPLSPPPMPLPAEVSSSTPTYVSPHTPSTEDRTPPVRSNVQGVYGETDTIIEKENREPGIENGNTLPAASRRLSHLDRSSRKAPPIISSPTEVKREETRPASVLAEAGSEVLRGTGLGAVFQAAEERNRRAREEALNRSRTRDSKKANLEGGKVPMALQRELNALGKVWAGEMKESFNVPSEWMHPERQQILNLLAAYKDAKVIENALRYMIRQWAKLNAKILKGKGSIPTVGFLHRFHAQVVPEAKTWAEVAAVVDEMDAWYREHPDQRPPVELRDRYQAYKSQIDSLGLG